MPYHLPVLLNPLVNSVFNCPNPANSNLKKLFSRLANQRFILLVPPCDKLLNYEDADSGALLQDLCYTFEFVASHVLLIEQTSNADKTTSAAHQVEFCTLNDKTVFVRSQNRILLTSVGFQSKRRCKILDIELFTNFNDYFLGTERCLIIHIDQPLYGNLVSRRKTRNSISRTVTEGSEIQNSATVVHDAKQQSKASFENIIRVHPDWMSKFNILFGEYRSTAVDDGPCEETFHKIIEHAFSKMSCDNIFQSVPNLQDLIHDYVELNLYDDIWVRLTNYFRISEVETHHLKYISLNQVETDLYSDSFEKFRLRNVVNIERNIELAVKSFNRISLTHTHGDKAAALVETLQNLSKKTEIELEDESPTVAMDADTLLSLFVLVVCRAQVKNLKSHLFYLQKFAKDDSCTKFGVLGYAMSTFEAVICYFDDLKGTKRAENLEVACKEAHQLLTLISGDDNNGIMNFCGFENSLHFRTEQGESVPCLLITYGKNEQLIELLSTHETTYPIEDLLEDETTDGGTLLIQALKHGNSTAATVIVDLLKVSCTQEELMLYVNRADKYKRTAAHYLTHEIEILQSIGGFINWKYRDSSGHTPLFTIFRSYDQQDYEQMMSASFQCAVDWYEDHGEQFKFSDHEDHKGNTLLHILKKSASILLEHEGVDINASNKKGLTPLMVYAKFNRLDNVKAVLNDKRTILGKVQYPLFLSCFDYARNPLILHELAQQAAKDSIFGLAFVHTLKCEGSSWLLHVTLRTEQTSFKTVRIHLKTLQNLFRALLKQYPVSFVPLENALEELSNLGKTRVSSVGKVETQYLLKNLTDCFNTLLYVGELKESIIMDDSKLISWLKLQGKTTKSGGIRDSRRKKVEPEEMNVMQNFLRFNQKELLSVQTKLQVMKKLAVFLRLKSRDVGESYGLFSLCASDYGIIKKPEQFCNNEGFSYIYGDGAIVTLVQEISFLHNCTTRLYNQTQHLLQVEIPDWWKFYGESLELHKQYAQNFPQLVHSGTSTSENGIIGKYLEGKRAKLEKRLSISISECRRSMDQAGNDIRKLHEVLAEELSKYMDFKGKFFESGIIRKCVRENVNVLRERLIHMQREIERRTIKGLFNNLSAV